MKRFIALFMVFILNVGGAVSGQDVTSPAKPGSSPPKDIGFEIAAGTDSYTVPYATLRFGTGGDFAAIPAGFFGPGSDPFEGVISFTGQHSMGSQVPMADVKISRTTNCTFPTFPSSSLVPIQITQVNIVSNFAVMVKREGGGGGGYQVESFFDVYLELQVGPPAMGNADITLLNEYGGNFGMMNTFVPLITFTNRDDPAESYVYNPEIYGQPPLQFNSTTNYPWTLSPRPEQLDPYGDEDFMQYTPAGSYIALIPLLAREDDNFIMEANEQGQVTGSGNGYENGIPFYYPFTNWWNVWFYDHPMKIDRKKYINGVMTLLPRIPTLPSTITIVYNYSTPAWPDWIQMPHPPLPSDLPNLELENIMITRTAPLFEFSGSIQQPIAIPLQNPYTIPDFNPEWLSVDIRGTNFVLNGVLNHVCFKNRIYAYDFGDAPDAVNPPKYPTLSVNNGAVHTIVPGIFMGLLIDGEADGQPNLNATGDDLNGLADEDGVTFNTPLKQGQPATITVVSSIGNVFLQAWIDFNADGDWADPTEQIALNLVTVAGNNPINFNVPVGAILGTTYARFRLSTMPWLPYNGAAPNGEVEDYTVTIEEMPVDMDFGDAPDPTYPTLLVNDGARHKLSGLILGALIDAEPDGQPSPNAMGDDLNALDDEDGFVGPCMYIPGHQADIVVTATGPGFLNLWIDFNMDGDWDDTGEHVFTDAGVVSGANQFAFIVPQNTVGGKTYARFRLCSLQGLTCTGLAADGEVEDYELIIEEDPDMDYGDAPDPTFPTLYNSGGPFHARGNPPGIVYLGNTIDYEFDGQPNPNATGDNINNLNDEDGVVFTTLYRGMVAGITVTASVSNGLLQGWFDFNGDGDWNESNEQVFIDVPLAAGPQSLNFNVPSGAVLGNVFARFRFSTTGNLSYTGCAPDGEAEDYMVVIEQHPPDMDYGDCPDPTYPTLLGSNGARHMMSGLRMGVLIDYEVDGFPTTNARGDDNNNQADEDGVRWPCNFVKGQSSTIQVTVNGSGFLQGWIDFNVDGDWTGQGEQVFINTNLVAGLNILSIMVPPGALSGPTYARFRFSSQYGLGFTGMAQDGEVEDYPVFIEPPYEMDYGDAPDVGYRTLTASNGARHAMGPPQVFMGGLVDYEIDGQPNPAATGDDDNPPALNDEDGVWFSTLLMQGQPAAVSVSGSPVGGVLQGWIDFNADGDWSEPPEQIIVNAPLLISPSTFNFNVPADAVLGQTYARFRYSTMGDLTWFGCAPNGEVEDYRVNIKTHPPDTTTFFGWIFGPGDTCFDATKVIITPPYMGTYTFITAGSNVTLIAGETIRLKDLTRVYEGAYLHAYIDPDGPWCPHSKMPQVPVISEEKQVVIEKASVKLYPNPTTGNFILELPRGVQEGMTFVNIYTLLGEKVLTGKLPTGGRYEFTLGEKPAGIYIFHIITGNTAETVKIIKQ